MIRITEEMLSSGQPVAQGEVLIWAKKYAPKSVLNAIANLKFTKELKLENDAMILGHSETGHHHVLEPVSKQVPLNKAVLALVDESNELFIDLKIMEECKLEHLRGNDTHQAYIFAPGEYIRGVRQEQNSLTAWQVSRD